MATYFAVPSDYAALAFGQTVNGVVLFTPNVNGVALDTSASPPLGWVPTPTVGAIVNGNLQTSIASSSPVYLQAQTSDLNLSGTLQYATSFQVTVGGVNVPVLGFLFNAQVPRTTSDAGITINTTTLTSATADFTSADVGAVVTVAGAIASGTSGTITTIVSVTNSTTAVLSSEATATVSGAALTVCQEIDLITVTPATSTVAFGDVSPTTFGTELVTAANSAAAVALLGLGPDVAEYSTFSALPGTGVVNQIYYTQDTHEFYIWNGSAYQLTSGGATVPSAGMVKSNGSALVDATAGTDYVAPGGALGTPSSGNAVNLTNFVSVQTYGAKADGSTDDTTAIGNAIAAASSLATISGQPVGVALMAGTHAVSFHATPGQSAGYYSCIELPSNIGLFGQGQGATVIKLIGSQTHSGNIITNADWSGAANHITLRDFTIDGNGANQSATPNTLLTAGAINWLYITDVECTRVQVKNFFGNSGTPPGETLGFQANWGSRLTYLGCSVIGTAGTQGSGFSANNSTNITHVGCFVSGMSASSGFTNWHCAQVMFSGCHAELCAVNGFNIELCHDVTFASCTAGGAASDTAGGHVYSNSQSLGNTLSGFCISDSVNVSLVGCIARNNGTQGLIALSETGFAVPQVTVSGGYFSNNGLGMVFDTVAAAQAAQISAETVIASNTNAPYSIAGAWFQTKPGWVTPVTTSVGELLPVQVITNGTETFTIAAGSVIQINGTSVNGYTPAFGDRILIPNAPAATGTGSSFGLSTQPTNGIYQVTGNTTNLTLIRAWDMSALGSPAGLTVFVENGSWYGGNKLTCTTPANAGAFVWGTTSLAFQVTGGVTPTMGTITLNSSLNFPAGSNTGALQGNSAALANTVITLPAETGTLRNQAARVTTITSSATPSINLGTTDVYGITALTVGITGVTLTGTATDGQRVHIYIVGTATRAVALGSSFEASTVALPTTTSGTNRLDIDCIWNAATSKLRVLQVS